MTDVIRSSQPGGSHGGAYLIDLATGEHRQVLDWNDGTIDWAGRGGGRGLRGIAFHDDEILIAASDEVFVFDRDFNVVRSHRNRYLSHCHEIVIDGRDLWLTSTLYNSVLSMDLESGRFTRGLYVRIAADRTGYEIATYDPSASPQVPAQDVLHLNSVWAEDGWVYACGLRFQNLIRARIDEVSTPGKVVRAEIYGNTPPGTHNARPYEQGLLCNSTQYDRIMYLTRQGHPTIELPVPKMPTDRLAGSDTPGDIARAGFGRGLCLAPGGVLIGGASPSTITAYSLRNRSELTRVTLTNDVRNAPHGLEVWPYHGPA